MRSKEGENKIDCNLGLTQSLLVGVLAMGIGAGCAVEGLKKGDITEFILGASEALSGYFCITVNAQFFDEAHKLEDINNKDL